MSILRLGTTESYDHGHFLTGQEGGERAIHVLVHGAVRVVLTTADGKEVVLFERKESGDLFGVGAIDAKLADVIVAEVLADETVLCRIRRSRVVEHATEYPSAAAWFLAILNDLVLEEQTKLSDLALH